MIDLFRHRITAVRAAIFLFLCIFSGSTSWAAEDFLDPAAAFKFSARMIDAKTAEVSYAIADGYYMYREHFSFRVEGAQLGIPAFPAGLVKFDETFQKNVETYHHSVSIRVPVEANAAFTLIATGQGCAEKGLCYPPMESQITLDPVINTEIQNAGLAGKSVDAGRLTLTTTPLTAAELPATTPISGMQTDADSGVFEVAIKGGNLLVI
ncbi:MAG TPA: protein-disulfide reductase DsbD N-terminal domain-containing protein, partial [Burkholderiaceae bacterium]|nr:protein-disulfide reductase DsbD N-terminal domain-containing protein [Burkholderiaceae bacterium]